jgi:hypothetical protein
MPAVSAVLAHSEARNRGVSAYVYVDAEAYVFHFLCRKRNKITQYTLPYRRLLHCARGQ